MKISYSNNYESFDYELECDEVNEALESTLDKFTKEELINLIVTELDIKPELESYFHDDIADYYELEAWDYYADSQICKYDPLGYWGMSQRDFL